MENSRHDISWLFRPGFIKWIAAGSIVSFLLVLLLTSPVLIRPVYQSEAIIYVPLTLFSSQFDQLGIGFGNNEEIDGHIQILRSARILDSLNSIYNLSDRLGIDINPPGGESRYHRTAGSMVRVEKTRYGAVSVSMRYADPELAASMVNRILILGDIIKEDMLLENRLTAYHFAKELYEQKLQEVSEMEKQIKNREFILPLKKDNSGSYSVGIDEVREYQARRIDINDPDAVRFVTVYEAELWELTSLKNRYELISMSLETPLPRSYIVSAAVAPDKSVWPPRLLLSFIAAAGFSIMMVFIRLIRMDAETRTK